MNKMLALAYYEFKGRINLKADMISLFLIALLIVSRLFAGNVAKENAPINLALLYEDMDSKVYSKVLAAMDEINVPVLTYRSSIADKIESGEIEAYLEICESCEEPTINVFSEKQFTAINYLNSIKEKLEPIFLPQMLDVSAGLYNKVVTGLKVQLVESNKDVYEQFLTINTLFMVLTVIGVLTAFAFLLQGITDEKSSKVTLMYMSCMEVNEWIDSKVLASTCLSLKNFIIYIALGGFGLTYFGFIELSSSEWSLFIKSKLIYLTLTFAIGYLFWCYLFALVSVLISDPNSPIKNAAVLLPMTAFGIVLSMLDFVSSPIFELLSFLPFTFLFTMSASIVLTNFDAGSFYLASIITLAFTFLLRNLAIKYVKFDD